MTGRRGAGDRAGGRAGVLALALAVVLAAVLPAAGGCARDVGGGDGTGGARVDRSTEASELARVEVKSYEGKDLSSVNDFRENSIKGPQQVDKATYRLRISGLVASPTALSYDEVVALPKYRKVVRLDCVEGWGVDILWEGVLVRELLAKAGGADPRAKIVIFRARDGYSTSFPLSYLTGRPILMADKMNGVVIPRERGFPFMLVAEDKWGYKWAKWVTEIEVSNDEDFEGYWESRGYENDATLPESKK